MSTLRTVHNEKELAAALEEHAEHIEIMGSLSQNALQIMMPYGSKRGVLLSRMVSAAPSLTLGYPRVLHPLRLFYKIAYESKTIVVVARSRNSSEEYLSQVGTEAWDALNGRRGDLVHKDIHGKLDHSEREELEELERICAAAIDQAFPLLEVDLEGLIRVRDQLPAEGAEHE